MTKKWSTKAAVQAISKKKQIKEAAENKRAMAEIIWKQPWHEAYSNPDQHI